MIAPAGPSGIDTTTPRSVGALSVALHRRVFADPERRLGDQLTLVGLLALAVGLHPFVYGWPLGFPLPGPHALFFPFLAPVALVVHALLGGALCWAWARRRGGRPPGNVLARHDWSV